MHYVKNRSSRKPVPDDAIRSGVRFPSINTSTRSDLD